MDPLVKILVFDTDEDIDFTRDDDHDAGPEEGDMSFGNDVEQDFVAAIKDHVPQVQVRFQGGLEDVQEIDAQKQSSAGAQTNADWKRNFHSRDDVGLPMFR